MLIRRPVELAISSSVASSDFKRAWATLRYSSPPIKPAILTKELSNLIKCIYKIYSEIFGYIVTDLNVNKENVNFHVATTTQRHINYWSDDLSRYSVVHNNI